MLMDVINGGIVHQSYISFSKSLTRGIHNQNTSGTVNAHLIPGVYLNTCFNVHVYSSRVRIEHSLDENF